MGWFGQIVDLTKDGFLTPTTAANIFQRRTAAVYGRWLPPVMGSGGSPVEEPTIQEMRCFLDRLDKVPLTFFGSAEPSSPDYGDEYHCVLKVKQWLRLLVTAELLRRVEP